MLCGHMDSQGNVTKDPLDGALDLMRRLPPRSLTENLYKVLALVPELTDDLLASVDQPLVSQVCSVSGKPFLLCDYNRDGSAYRYGAWRTYVPWDNC